MAKNCIRLFGITDLSLIDNLTIAQYEIMMEALDLRQVDENFQAHRQAFLNFSVQAEKSTGKGKTKPVYRRFRQFFDYDEELAKADNRRKKSKKKSRFSGIGSLLKKGV